MIEMTRIMKIKINHCESRRFLKESRRRKHTSLRKENSYYRKHGKYHYRFKNILANISEELASDDKLQFICNLNNMSNNCKTFTKYEKNKDCTIKNNFQRIPSKIMCNSISNAAPNNDTYWKPGCRKPIMSRTLVTAVNAKIMNSNIVCMTKRFSFTNNHYKKREGENKICVKWSQSFDKDQNYTVRHIISPINNILRSHVPETATDNTLTVIGERKDKRFVNKCMAEEQVTKRFSYKINKKKMLQKCLHSRSYNVSLRKLKIELSKCKGIRDRHNNVNNRTKYRSNTQPNKFNIKIKIGVIGCRSNTRTRRKRFLKSNLGRKEINYDGEYYGEYYIIPLKCQRQVKDREKGYSPNKCFKEMSHEIEDYDQLRNNKYFSRSQEYEQNPFCVSSMFVKDPFISPYKRQYNVFNLEYVISKNKLCNTCTSIDITNYKKFKAKAFSLHEIYTKNTDSNSKSNKFIKTWYNRPNTSLRSYSDTVIRNNNEYKYETPFCFEILPIEPRVIHVKLKPNMYEDILVSSNSSLCRHQNEVEQECYKTKKPMFLEKIIEQGQMQLKKIMIEVKRAISDKKKILNKYVNKENVMKKAKICLQRPSKKQYPKDVGFRASVSFNVGVCKPRVKQIRSLSKCDSGKYFKFMSHARL